MKIDYSHTLEWMILQNRFGDLGNNWNKLITAKLFPVVGTGVQEFEHWLHIFDRKMGTSEVLNLIQEKDSANPWQPAKIEHGLAFAMEYPGKQTLSAIALLGSVGQIEGCDHVPILGVNHKGRNLVVGRSDVTWLPGCYSFLAVRLVTCHK